MHAEELTKQLRAPDQRGCGRVQQIETGADNIDRLAALDASAVAVREWNSAVIPGNLQTIAYSAAIIKAAHWRLPSQEVRRRVLLKSARSRAFTSNDSLEYACFVVGERAIVGAITGDAEHIEQLEHLLILARMPRFVVRVLPEDPPPPGMADSFSLYRLDDEHRVGYVETVMGAWYSTRSDDITRLSSVFDEIRRIAMSPPDSERFIRGVLESWQGRKTESLASTAERPSSSVRTPRRETTASGWRRQGPEQ